MFVRTEFKFQNDVGQMIKFDVKIVGWNLLRVITVLVLYFQKPSHSNKFKFYISINLFIYFCSIAHTLSVNQELSRLLRLCIDFYNNILTLIQLKYFSPLLDKFDYTSRKSLALYIVLNILENETLIPTADEADSVLVMIAPLIKDENDQAPDKLDPEDFAEEQGIAGRFVHLLKSDDPDMQYKILQVARKHFGLGGTQRIKHVLPPLIFQAFQLANKYKQIAEEDTNWDKKCQKILQFCHSTISVLARADLPDLALRLYLQGALVIGQIGYTNHETVAYDFMTQVSVIIICLNH